MSQLCWRFAVTSMVLVIFGYAVVYKVQTNVNLYTTPVIFRYGGQLSEVNNYFLANTGNTNGDLRMCEKME